MRLHLEVIWCGLSAAVHQARLYSVKGNGASRDARRRWPHWSSITHSHGRRNGPKPRPHGRRRRHRAATRQRRSPARYQIAHSQPNRSGRSSSQHPKHVRDEQVRASLASLSRRVNQPVRHPRIDERTARTNSTKPRDEVAILLLQQRGQRESARLDQRARIALRATRRARRRGR